jgi:hypothetical protein
MQWRALSYAERRARVRTNGRGPQAKRLSIPPRTMGMKVYSGAAVEGRQPFVKSARGNNGTARVSRNTLSMSHDSDASYRCPKCGATSALLLPQPVTRESQVALKCLQCAHVLRIPRRVLKGAVNRFDSTGSLE